MESCANCRFSTQTVNSSNQVICRRFPPVNYNERARFPVLFDYAWCGEWKPAAAPGVPL